LPIRVNESSRILFFLTTCSCPGGT
jgi:hypothetical protein